MQNRKKKRYFFDEQEELTKYAKKKFKKLNAQINEDESLKENVIASLNIESDNNFAHEIELPSCSFDSTGDYNNSCPTKTLLEVKLQNDCLEENDSSPTNLSPEIDCTKENENLSLIEVFPKSSDGMSHNLEKLENEWHCFKQIETEESIDFHIKLSIDEPSFGFNEKSIADNVFSSDEEDLVEYLQRGNEYMSRVENFINQKEVLEPLILNCSRSSAEILLMGLKLSIANKFTFTAITGLFQYVNKLFGEKVLPETRYMINKILNLDKNVNCTFHSVCLQCSNYLGTFEKEKLVICDNCNEQVNLCNVSDPSFFVLIDSSQAICDYLNSHEDYYMYTINERIHERNHIRDIYDGIAYRKFVKKLSTEDRQAYVTAILNTDGAPVFKSSSYSIWPIYIMLNEIPTRNRFNSLIVVGLWFGKSKPEMSVILEKFVCQMNEYSTIGIPCKIKEKTLRIKLFIIAACVDTIARAPMNGTTQFNGKYGCDWCEHPGIYSEGSMRYPFLDPPAPLRSKESTVKYAKEALESSAPIKGIKNASPLLCLHGFDIITSFSPDYMHCMLAGVARQFTEYLLGMLSESGINLLNELLSQIKAPHQIVRLSRDITDRGNWKCREWENWVLYYSLPLLDILIPRKKYLRHWSLFVEALHLSLQTDITYDQLNHIDNLLNAFVAQVEELYTLKAMTYNVHQLQHIAKSIGNWGPLWAHSAFAFESANHQLLCSIKSARGVILQIIRYINMQRFTKLLEDKVYPITSVEIMNYCTNITTAKAMNVFKLSSISYFGRERIIDTDSSNKFNISKNTKIFRKMVKDGCLFTSSNKINQRSCNHFAQLKDGRFIKIIDFLVDVNRKVELTTCQVIKTKIKTHLYGIIEDVLQISDEIITVFTEEIVKICVFVETNSCKQITAVPNLHFY